jgi:hypothetical protein
MVFFQNENGEAVHGNPRLPLRKSQIQAQFRSHHLARRVAAAKLAQHVDALFSREFVGLDEFLVKRNSI